MGKTIAVMQPTYLPWLGYFDLIRNADVFVIYNSVQFEKQSWQQRNRIRSKQGELLLTVPVKSHLGDRICDVQIDHSRNGLIKHLKSIEQNYSKAPNFEAWFPEIQEIYQQKNNLLQDLNLALIRLGMKALQIETELVFSSDLEVQGAKVEALIDICKKLGAINYLSPKGASDYISENNLFPENGIELQYQQFAHPVYAQLGFPDFISHLSFIDFIFNSDHRNF